MTVFLIGNGFDLNCGMNTRFSDVYKGYIKEPSSSDIVRDFKKSISGNVDSWGDFEMMMCEYAVSLNSEEELLECVRDFSLYMRQYLARERDRFLQDLENPECIKAIRSEMRTSFSSFYKGISHNVDLLMDNRKAGELHNIRVISFNYTNVFDLAFEEGFGQYAAPKVIHIHGELEDAPILGIDNMDQWKAAYPLTRKGQRGFVKPVFNEMYDAQRVELAMNSIRQANTICTFGLSLGESDLTWRNELISWLKQDGRNHLFLYLYELSQMNFRTVDEQMDMEDDKKESLLRDWGIDYDDALFDRIHIPCGRNIFNLGALF